MVGIYWNNHHHLMQVVHTIDGRTLWANMHLLFWLSLMPLGTAWLGEQGVETGPGRRLRDRAARVRDRLHAAHLVAARDPRSGSQLAQAIGSDRKGRISLVLYIVALALAGVFPWGSIAIFVAVAFIWFLPDRRVERVVGSAWRLRARSGGCGDDAKRLGIGQLDHVTRAQLAPATALGLAVDDDRERPDQVLRLAAGVDDAGELQQLAEADELARYLDVAHRRRS